MILSRRSFEFIQIDKIDQLTPKNTCVVRIDVTDFTFSGGEFNLTWTVVSLAPVLQYHLQYRQIEVDLFLDAVVIVEVDGDGDDCNDDSWQIVKL